MSNRTLRRWLVVVSLVVGASPAAADPFSFLAPGFRQEVYCSIPEFAGGVAFAPDGDLWVSNGVFSDGILRRIDAQSTVIQNGTVIHPVILTVGTTSGLGLTNHPDGFLYSNTSTGVTRQDAETGLPAGGPFGPSGNALGIATSPITSELVYVGAGGILNAVDPGFTTIRVFSAQLNGRFVDGVFFDPTGDFLFAAVRTGGFSVAVIRSSDGSIVQSIPMSSEPDGIAFKPFPPRFVVTANTNGTMTRFDFPGDDFTLPPTVTNFASGGFRCDLTDVGPDRCLYVTQQGTRFDDGTISGDNSVVRICSAACQSVADFDTVAGAQIPVGTPVAGQFANRGVLVSGASRDGGGLPGAFTNRQGGAGSDSDDLIPTTGPNFLTTSSMSPFDPNDSDFGRVRFDFVDPLTGAPRSSDFVSLDFLDVEDSGSPGGRGRSLLRAIRADGSVVEVRVPVGGNGDSQTMSIGEIGNGDAFVAAEAIFGDSGDSAAVDTLCFNLTAPALELCCDCGTEEVARGETIDFRVGVRNNAGSRLDLRFTLTAALAGRPPKATLLSRMAFVPRDADSLMGPGRRSVPITIPDDLPSGLTGARIQFTVHATDPVEGYDLARNVTFVTLLP